MGLLVGVVKFVDYGFGKDFKMTQKKKIVLLFTAAFTYVMKMIKIYNLNKLFWPYAA